MRLEEFWGVGPKTAERLRDSLGEVEAVDAIESADVRRLVEAGVTRGRATRILRRAQGEAGMDLLATRDVRKVYDDLVTRAAAHAVTAHAADRIRVLTPLTDRAEQEARLDEVLAARDAWRALDEGGRTRVIDAFEAYDDAEVTKPAAVRAALALREAGLGGETFAALEDIDEDRLADAADALEALDADEQVATGADAELDRLRTQLAAAEELEGSAFDLIDSIRERGVRDLSEFRHAFVEYVAAETDLTRGTVTATTADDAVDAADFVSSSLRALVADRRARVDERETTVRTELEAAVDEVRDDVERAVSAVDDIAVALSLGRFADANDLTRPTLVEDGLAVDRARNLGLSDPQPVSYGIGNHSLTAPSSDRVAVLTGANSGGKTTLLETLCQVALLASMGLPVPAERAAVGRFDAVVFHRRHASFNAGVLESTLKTIVPPLSREGRTLMLVDEFEAITEPGRAADLLNGLVSLTVDRDALGVYVTHLADDLSPLPDEARTDGIFAEGLTPDLELEVDYQPRFGQIGTSTPEFIVSRLVANARDRTERQGFEALAAAVGEEAVQQTLSDARWSK
ncbi:helix-hairpin-helix domain-containing protein [Salinigranum halophilum]|uniref:helix-hairpin-helix domain-containing protein n=1 Tax=Salinigranum halophilum TaxID=2565931 RepID=UPI0010A8DF8B|nr:helix-hairpin-helix domain-containing protein [Salinigranum halophilum]